MASKNEYLRRYMLERYHRRRLKAIADLGGKCTSCGATDNLEFDHIDRDSKQFTVGRGGSVSDQRWSEEIAKCQLLCVDCHEDKTRKEIGAENARETHGTLSSYRYCHCDLCRDAKREYNRNYKRRRHTLKG